MENKDRKETPKEKEPKKSPEARIEELIETGKQNGVLTYKEVMDTLNELELDAEQIERIYDRLEALNIYVVDEVEVPQDINEDIAEIENDIGGKASPSTTRFACILRRSARSSFCPPRRRSIWPNAWRKGTRRPNRSWRKPTFGWWCPWPSVMWAGACSFWI